MADEVYTAFAVAKSKMSLELFQGSSVNRGLLFEEFLKWGITKNITFAYLSSYSFKKKEFKVWEMEPNEVGFTPRLLKKKEYDTFFAKNKAARTPYVEFALQVLDSYLVPFWNKGKAVKLDLTFFNATMRVYCDLPENEGFYKKGFEVCT